jgi:hypothetical protein
MAMLHDQDQIKRDKAAIDAGRCPETGIDLTAVDIENHIASYFPHGDKPEHAQTDYGRRYRLIRAFGERRRSSNKETS